MPLKPAYPTGPEAIAKHGYDPKEIAAGMLLLHNEAHGQRPDYAQIDHDRLYDIARKRSKMQRDYEKRQKAAASDDGDGIYDRMRRDGLLKRLEKEFHGWYGEHGNEKLNWAGRGPLGNWRQIENFLKDKYPEAHRGLEAGVESARPVLDDSPRPGDAAATLPYQTGSDAIAQHGYDPKEIAAGMLYLHNRTHPGRQDPGWLTMDTDRLVDIARKRSEMERQYEQRSAAANRTTPISPSPLTDDIIYGISREFTDWAKENKKGNPYDDRAWEKRQRGQIPKTRGPIGYWPNVEEFLKERYPAGHRGLTYGFEDAMPLLDYERKDEPLPWLDGKEDYETGHEAVQKYGYDPKEVVSALLLLHNDTHHGRENYVKHDQERLLDIARKRHKMQQEYEQSQKGDRVLAAALSAIREAAEVIKPKIATQIGGDCYEAAAHYMLDNAYGKGLHNLRLVHGEVAGQGPLEGMTYGHAWVEDGDTVIDRSNGRNIVMPKADYYALGQIDKLNNSHVYTFEEARAKMLEHGVYGPWDLKGKHPNYYTLDEYNSRYGALVTAAPVRQDIVNRLSKEFDQWWKGTGETWDAYEQDDDDERGPIGDWPTVEGFLKEKYPAAHRGLMMGQEMARPLLDGVGRHDEDPTLPGQRNFNMLQVTYGDNKIAPYETGPEARGQHGYDPREVAAAMLLLHNKSHPLRGYRADEDQARLKEFANADVDVLHDIAQKRHKMHNQAVAHRIAMPAVDAYDPPGFDEAIDGSPEDPPVYPGPWYHGTDTKLPEGTVLVPKGGQKNSLGNGREKWVWVTDNPKHAKAYGPYVYEVAPSVEGPWPWNGDKGAGRFVAPRATVKRLLSDMEIAGHPRYYGNDIHSPASEFYQRTAMPVPTTIPNNRKSWEAENGKLNEKAQKGGVPVALVPNFSMDASDFAHQAYQHQWDNRSWSARPVEYEGRGVPGGISHRYLEVGNGKIPVNYLLHHGDDGQINGILSHFPEGTPFEKPGSITVTVHPSHRKKGVGAALVNAAVDRFGIDLDSQEYTPLGYELYRKLKPQSPNIFKEKVRTAAIDQDYINNLSNQFHDWYGREGIEALQQNDPNMDLAEQLGEHHAQNGDHSATDALLDFVHEGRQAEIDNRGPIGYWPNVENFLKKHYPAAHKNHAAGMEHAGEDLDQGGYETGPGAIAKHGYDPAEVAASMVLLHNKSHPLRGTLARQDMMRLVKIYMVRENMQRKYEERTKKERGLVTAYSDQTKFQTDFADDLKTGEPLDEQQLRFIDYMNRFNDMKANGRGEYTPRGGWPKSGSLLRIATEALIDVPGGTWRGVQNDTNHPTPESEAYFAERAKTFQQEHGFSLDDFQKLFNDWVIAHPPWDAASKRPHTPETAIKDWPGAVFPFLQHLSPTGVTVRPDFAEGFDNRSIRDVIRKGDIDPWVEAALALHTKANGFHTVYNTVMERNKGIAREKEQAKSLKRDFSDSTAKGYGVDDRGNIVLRPEVIQPQQQIQYPRGEDVRSQTVTLPRQNPTQQPADTTPKPMGMGRGAAILREAEATIKLASRVLRTAAWWEMETKNKGYAKGRYYSDRNRSRDNLVKKLYGPGHTYQDAQKAGDFRYVGHIIGPDGQVVDHVLYHTSVF